MALPTLTWRQLPTQQITFGSTAIDPVLDAIYTSFASTTYADGTARTPGAGMAWSASKYQASGTTEAIYVTPVSSSLNQRVVFAGSSSVRAATAAQNNSIVANYLYFGLGKNVTTNAASWFANSGSPFSNGQFSGYAYLANRNASYITFVRIYESSDAIFFSLEQNGSLVGTGVIGAWLDPESSDTTSDAESDGKLYGFSWGVPGLAIGNVSQSAATLFSSASPSSFNGNPPLNGSARTMVFVPGSASMSNLHMCWIGQPAATIKTRSLKNVRLPILLGLAFVTGGAPNTASVVATSYFIGRVREIWFFGNGSNGTKFSNGASDIGYVVAGSSSATGFGILLSL